MLYRCHCHHPIIVSFTLSLSESNYHQTFLHFDSFLQTGTHFSSQSSSSSSPSPPSSSSDQRHRIAIAVIKRKEMRTEMKERKEKFDSFYFIWFDSGMYRFCTDFVAFSFSNIKFPFFFFVSSSLCTFYRSARILYTLRHCHFLSKVERAMAISEMIPIGFIFCLERAVASVPISVWLFTFPARLLLLPIPLDFLPFGLREDGFDELNTKLK